MSALIYNNTQINYELSNAYGKLFLNSDVALGYGVTNKNIDYYLSKNQDELIEGTHYIYDYAMTNGGRQRVIKWTSLGVYHLGFFIKSKQAKEFRKFMANVANAIDMFKINDKSNVYQISGYKSQIAQHNNKIALLESRVQELSSKNESLKVQNIKLYEEAKENESFINKMKNLLGVSELKLSASEHNAILEIIYQMVSFNNDLSEIINVCKMRKEAIGNYVKNFTSNYGKCEDYAIGLNTKKLGALQSKYRI